jgi:glycosyltransferase involved in cell wall biosynthesis
MRILLANEARRGAGGVETYLASLAGALIARGHELALLYANPSREQGPTSVDLREAWSVADEGLDAAIARVRDWRPDICFSHNMRPLEVDERLLAEWPTVKMMHGYFGTCVSGHKAFSFPSIVACTRPCNAGCLAHYLPRRCGQLRPDLMLTQYAWAMRQQSLFDRYAAIVVASDHMRLEYRRYGLAADHVHAIPLFGAERDLPASPGEPRIDVLFVGRMTTLKGPAVLIRAAAHAAAAVGRRLRVVAAGNGQDRATVERLARGFETEGRLSVECPGWVDAARRATLLARATLVAVPSLWPEPFGLVGLEAAQHGVPAVAFDVGGVRSWLEDGVNGRLVDPAGGAAAFGDAIAAILGDTATRARLSTGARTSAARLSADAHVTALEQVFAAAPHARQWPPAGTS